MVCTALIWVELAVSVESVKVETASPFLDLKVLLAWRSSVIWTALTGVTCDVSGSLVNVKDAWDKAGQKRANTWRKPTTIKESPLARILNLIRGCLSPWGCRNMVTARSVPPKKSQAGMSPGLAQ